MSNRFAILLAVSGALAWAAALWHTHSAAPGGLGEHAAAAAMHGSEMSRPRSTDEPAPRADAGRETRQRDERRHRERPRHVGTQKSQAALLRPLRGEPEAPLALDGASDWPHPGSQFRGGLGTERIEQVLEIAAELDPEMAERLRAICDADAAHFEQVLRRSGRNLLALAELQDRDPDLYQLKLSEMKIERQVTRVALQLADARRAGRESDAANLERDLRMLLQQEVALSIRARGDYLLRLQEQIDLLRKEIESDASNFDETVQRRFQAVLERAEARSQLAADREAPAVR